MLIDDNRLKGKQVYVGARCLSPVPWHWPGLSLDSPSFCSFAIRVVPSIDTNQILALINLKALNKPNPLSKHWLDYIGLSCWRGNVICLVHVVEQGYCCGKYSSDGRNGTAHQPKVTGFTNTMKRICSRRTKLSIRVSPTIIIPVSQLQHKISSSIISQRTDCVPSSLHDTFVIVCQTAFRKYVLASGLPPTCNGRKNKTTSFSMVVLTWLAQCASSMRGFESH